MPEPRGHEEELLLTPGHLGDLTRSLPVELVDAVLEECQVFERRRRLLPSRLGGGLRPGVIPVPCAGLSARDKLTAALAGRNVCQPRGLALRCLWRRLGIAPLKALFEVVAGPLAQPTTSGTCYRCSRTVRLRRLQCGQSRRLGTEPAWLGIVQARLGSDLVRGSCRSSGRCGRGSGRRSWST
ncbi:transposase domain-containing protein [Streptomyces sp. NPDC091376]|uniref:transposase domain-containing protein n=1 Tax=Streptomyces sp. NPDC091376 TaxID=3365994 RepID=UPI00381CA1A2